MQDSEHRYPVVNVGHVYRLYFYRVATW